MRTSEELVQEFDKVSSDVGRLQAWESTLLPEEMQLLADRLIPRVGGSRFTELHETTKQAAANRARTGDGAIGELFGSDRVRRDPRF